jgi:hypothetical protein
LDQQLSLKTECKAVGEIMNTAIHATVALTLCVFCSLVHGQETHGMAWVTPNGTRTTLNLQTGYTAIDKSGQETHLSPTDLNQLCGEIDKQDHPLTGSAEKSLALMCDKWQELQPRTQIERVTLSQFVARLLFVSPAGTGFERYRGMKINSDGDSAVFDATMVPQGLGDKVSCVILDNDKTHSGGSASYQCTIPATSYPTAVELEKTLVTGLNGLHLEEDEVAEHGLAASGRNEGRCAPSRECAHAHLYVSIQAGSKRLLIGAEPDFIRDPLAEMRAEEHGQHAPITRIATDSGTVKIEVISLAVE